MRIALAQINSTLGDFSSNREKICQFAEKARLERCDLVVFPEHSLVGYLPGDLLERESVIEEQLVELTLLEKQLPKGVAVIVGCVTRARLPKHKTAAASSLAIKRWHNSVALIERGKPTQYFHKERLPAYDVFDETRHMLSGSLQKGRVRFRGKVLQITICEDIWGWLDLDNPIARLKRTGVDLVINCSASPFTDSKRAGRVAVTKATARHFKAPMVYVNMVGAQDEVVFDGRSLVLDKSGKVISELPACEEHMAIYNLKTGKMDTKVAPREKSESTLLRNVIALGIRDFLQKTGLKKCHLGLSGGIDSAVVACLAVDALGPDAVVGITMPGPFNDPKSKEWAEQLAQNLGIRCLNLPIESSYQALRDSFEMGTGKAEFGVVNENLQARVRGVLLMAYANKESSLLLSTGNKAELAAGYSTLYGDQCGGLAPIADLLKRNVYALADEINKEKTVIPESIIQRPPTAELRPNQKDQDTLPPYDVLDDAVVQLVEKRKAAKTEIEKWLLGAMYRSEFKRRQAPPILKLTDHAFGIGRRFPIAHRAKK